MCLYILQDARSCPNKGVYRYRYSPGGDIDIDIIIALGGRDVDIDIDIALGGGSPGRYIDIANQVGKIIQIIFL